jgi:preprotein translocase subunit YajC
MTTFVCCLAAAMMFDGGGLLGQALPSTQPTTTAPVAAPPGGMEIFMRQFVPLILLLVVLWAIMIWPRQREQRRMQDMLSNLKRNDRVVTIGGVVGTVVDVRDDEVVLKVDESNNVKIKFLRSSIREVLRDTTDEKKQ